MMRASILLLTLAACQNLKSQTANTISTIQLDLIDPTDTGTPENPVSVRQATISLFALDDKGAPWTQDVDVDVYISFGGVKTGLLTNCGADVNGTQPIQTIHLAGGQAVNQTVVLPQAFGATTIWIDEHTSHATGASPTIYFRNPLISDIQTPPDLTATNATFCSPFNGKFIIVDRASGSGQLVVSSVFIDAFAVTDTGANAFNSMYVYSFGKPPSYIVPGKVLTNFSGNVSKFVGFTELNFPLFQAADNTVPLATVPAPVVLDWKLLMGRMDTTLLQYDASVVSVTGKICDPNAPSAITQWLKYSSFTVDNDGTCSSLTNWGVQLPAKTLGNFDPTMVVGHNATFVGMLRNNSGQNPILDVNGMTVPCNDTTLICDQGTCTDGICKKGVFNFWTVNPRDGSDVTVQ
jgi:hypothetical protein